MNEPHLRFNPLLGTWNMTAANRQGRPHLPKDVCPFCPGQGKVPDSYGVMAYPNDFPVLSEQPASVSPPPFPYAAAEAYGKCEVILYTDNHHATLHSLPLEQIEDIVRLWVERNQALSADRNIKYVYPFENRGEEVGVTMHHPHGQLYAYGWLPLKIQTELLNTKAFFEREKQNFFDCMIHAEEKTGNRMLVSDEHFSSFIPWFTDYPFGVFITARKACNLSEFTPQEITALSVQLKKITAAFDALYQRPFPYMMVIHQTPVNLPEWNQAAQHFRFHIEFYPPLRAADKIKWYASSEMGAWAAANPLNVDDTAQQLKACLDLIQ